jgi:flavin-dependent thymidylate synthase
MNVILAGYNVDIEELNKLKTGDTSVTLTPETFSSAYARISRYPEPVNELRQKACREVDKARISNKIIIFDMGHSSVAEHAVFNFDILGLSRLAVEDLENFRLVSFTEKSQRYITLEDDYVIPKEITDDNIKQLFKETIAKQNKFYWELFDKLKQHVYDSNPKLAENKKNKDLLEGWAKEDARYIVSLATECQLGMTINARSLELILRRFSSNNLLEINELGKNLYENVKEIAPSIIRYCTENKYDKETYSNISNSFNNSIDNETSEAINEVNLIDFTPDMDNKILASILHTANNISFEQAKIIVNNMKQNEKISLIKTVFENMNFYDKSLREFEYGDFTFELIVSSSCFAQLKRHRMATITKQNYNPELGVTIPEAIKQINLEKEFLEIINETNTAYKTITSVYNENIGQYILTNSHRRRVLIKCNVRELYHISRLREDSHAQWDIKNISKQMTELAKEKAPLTLKLICGKDCFEDIKKEL